MSDINFLEVDSETILQNTISEFETALGATLYPGDERRIFLQQMVQVLIGIANSINNTGRNNLLRYATGSMLDAIGEFYDCTRLSAQKSKVTLRFTLSAAQASNISIPKGTRATPDGELYFATSSDLTIIAGQTTGNISAEATVAGSSYNGYAAAQIKTIVDPITFVSSVSNIDESSGGRDTETDDAYRERIRLAPGSFSVAGPEEAYIYWAKSADSSIVDVKVSSPTAGTVQIVPLLSGGEIPGQAILDKVLAAVSASKRRPLTDNVQVIAPTQVSYDITLTYYISSANQTQESAIRDAIENTNGAIDQYKDWQSAILGRAVNPDQLRYLMLYAGASRVILTAPTYAELTNTQVAAVGTVTITYGGLE